jgi:hypothetical protein
MSENNFPERKQHPQLAHAFVELPNEKKLLLGSFRQMIKHDLSIYTLSAQCQQNLDIGPET